MSEVTRVRAGLVLIIAGALAMAWAGWRSYEFRESPLLVQSLGGLAAAGMFFVILGTVFFFPTMLTDTEGQTSTMRVAVLLVVSLFVVLTLKTGWGATKLSELDIQQNWAWVLAAAFGGKALQSFSENKDLGNAKGGKPNPLQLPQ
jgi:hypothetical protein